MKFENLTNEHVVNIYNASELCDHECDESHLEIEWYKKESFSVHLKSCYDDMQLCVTKDGGLWLYCLDDGDIYGGVLSVLKFMKQMDLEPFA